MKKEKLLKRLKQNLNRKVTGVCLLYTSDAADE